MKRPLVNPHLHLIALAVCSLLSLRLAAQDAKQLFDQSLVEGNSCKKMQLACQAAKLDPKKKDYQDACDRFRTSTNRSDETFRVKAIDSLSKNDFSGALRWTNSFVCNADTKASLQSQIADAQKASSPAAPTPAPIVAVQKADQSSTFLGEARSSFSEGKFDAAVASAKQVTDANLKPYADEIVNKVGAYRAAVSAAHSSEASKDYQGAINNWRTAQAINGNGPDSPGVNIARLEPFTRQAAPAAQPAPVQVANRPAPPPLSAKQAPPPPVDINAQVGKLLDDAGKASAAGQLPVALRGYESVLRLQPANTTALSGKADIEKKINSDPAEQAKSLAQAIHDFYSSKFADAEDGLRSYLDAPTAKSKGAAYFYLGATRLYEKILSSSAQKADTAIASAEVQRPFKDAHAAGYQPVERLVSPVVMRAWRNAQ